MRCSLRCIAVFLMGAVSSAVASSAGPAISSDDRYLTLIKSLDDPDPSLRGLATQRLIDAGQPARPALSRAIATTDSEASGRIAYILLHTKWVSDTDPEIVKQAMLGYADADAESRRLKVDAVQQAQAIDPLPRILLHDPCAAVRWEAAFFIAQILDSTNDPAPPQLNIAITGRTAGGDEYPSPAENAPLLALSGWALRLTNPARADELLNRAIAIEIDHPSAYNGQADFAFNWLIQRATTQKQYARVIELFRALADRSAWDDQNLPPAVSGLIAAQADFGPFPGFDDDLRNYRGYFTHPEMLYCVGRWMDRRHHPVLAGSIDAAALVIGAFSTDSHCITGSFLVERGWDTAAERELRLALILSGGTSINAYLQLSELANHRDDDLGAAKNLEAAVRMLANNNDFTRASDGRRVAWTQEDAWADVHWHYLRAARSTHDAAGTTLRLEKLLTLDHDAQVLQRDPGMAADIVPALQDLGRRDEADKIFNAAYDALTDKITKAPDDPMPRNNLAWLCAQSNRKLDQAVRLAGEAVALVPDDAACLDTQAEAYFREGQAAKAIEIETHALQVKPDDVYMQKQLKRFSQAK
jgi:tetratricopeptide (TPR) repeat protein